MITLGARVAVNDPSWHRHGEVGTIVKINRRTVRVLADNGDTIVGAPDYFEVIPS